MDFINASAKALNDWAYAKENFSTELADMVDCLLFWVDASAVVPHITRFSSTEPWEMTGYELIFNYCESFRHL